MGANFADALVAERALASSLAFPRRTKPAANEAARAGEKPTHKDRPIPNKPTSGTFIERNTAN
jgi:hypothetical protein